MCLFCRLKISFLLEKNHLLFPFPSKHGEVRTTNCDLTTGYCKKHDECTNNFANYILGCYYDPFPPHLLSGDSFRFGGQDNGDISIAGCIKACGEEGFMLAGLRLVLIRKLLSLTDIFCCQGPPVLPLWKCGAPLGVQGWMGPVRNFVSSHSDVASSRAGDI